MTKTCKRTLLIALVTLLLAVCSVFFVACDEDAPTDNSVAYTVTVKADNAPASGVKIAVKKGGATFETKTTDANGKVTFMLVPESYQITLADLPEHYGLPQDASLDLSATERDLTVTLVKNFGYVVNLVGTDDKPYYAEGVTVGICTLAGNCLEPVALGADGVAFIEANKSDYHVQIKGLPLDVAYECDSDGYYTGKNFSATETEMTVKLHPVTDVQSVTPMTDDEKKAYGETKYGFNAAAPAYKLTKTLKPSETVYYSITPAYSSRYSAYYDYEANYLYNGTAFQLGNKGSFMSLPVLQADTTYYFNVSNTDSADITFECVISAPLASYHEIDATGTVNVTLDDKDANAVIAFTPATAGAYELTAQGEQLTDIVYCPYSAGIENTKHADGAFKKNATASAKVTEKFAGTKALYFAIAAKDAAKFKVTVEKLNDVKDTTVVKHAQQALTPFADRSGAQLTYVPVNGTAELYYDEANGYYRLGGADGAVVVVRLTTSIDDEDRFLDKGGLIYLDEVSEGVFAHPYVFDTTSDEDLANLEKGNTYTDYGVMLRGFSEYEIEDGSFVKPEIKEQSYYAKCVNKDGVYPLTKELEQFLKIFAENYGFKMPIDAVAGHEWLFACYYYEDASQLDAIVGTYDLVSFTENGDKYTVGVQYNNFGTMVDVTAQSFVLRVTRSGFTVTDNLLQSYDFVGKWQKDGSTYKLSVTVEKQNPDTFAMEQVDIEVEATVDTANGKITITRNDDVEISFEFTKKA